VSDALIYRANANCLAIAALILSHLLMSFFFKPTHVYCRHFNRAPMLNSLSPIQCLHASRLICTANNISLQMWIPIQKNKHTTGRADSRRLLRVYSVVCIYLAGPIQEGAYTCARNKRRILFQPKLLLPSFDFCSAQSNANQLAVHAVPAAVMLNSV